MKNQWLAATLLAAVIAIAGCASTRQTGAETETPSAPSASQVIAKSQAEINCPFLNSKITIQNIGVPEKDSSWSWYDYGSPSPQFSDYRFRIYCRMGGLVAGENKNYFYCTFDSGCVEITENDVLKGYLRTYVKAGYSMTGYALDHVKFYGSGNNQANTTTYNISANLAECKTQQVEKAKSTDCYQDKFEW